jgi:high-affinity nickel permease
MFGLDDSIAGLAHGEMLALVLLVALLLGLRHASDPDHLAAVSTLVASEPQDGTRGAGRLGLTRGLGHAVALVAFGLPVVLFHAYLPDGVQRGAEALAGLIIVVLAVRLLIRTRAPGERLGRSPPAAFGVGLVHGMGGSAGVGVLLLATIPGQGAAVAALAVLALGTAISMTLLSSAFGYAITRGPVHGRVVALTPAMGTATLVFGAWYVLAALGAAPYGL